MKANKWCTQAFKQLIGEKLPTHFDSPHVYVLSFILCSDWLWQHINVSVHDTHQITTTNWVLRATNTLTYTQMLVYTLLILMSIDSNQPLTPHSTSFLQPFVLHSSTAVLPVISGLQTQVQIVHRWSVTAHFQQEILPLCTVDESGFNP